MARSVVLLPVLAVALAGCAGAATVTPGAGTPSPAISSSPSDTIRLDASANGSTVPVAPGTPIILELDSNPTTGYSWMVTSLPDAGHVALDSPIDGVYTATPVASSVVGSGGTQSWDLHATKAGTTSIALAYARPWESGVPPVEAFSVTFVVQ
jgi:inhibitor of cysteine peptidase